MKNTYQIISLTGEALCDIQIVENGNGWVAEKPFVAEGAKIPHFADDSAALLMNTIERWCIINNLTIRPALTLTKGNGRYDYYYINDEPVFLSFKWVVDAKFYRRKSKRVRLEHFEVCSEDRDGARRQAEIKFKGASLRELVSLTPCGWGACYYKNRPGFPSIEHETLNRLQMPDNL